MINLFLLWAGASVLLILIMTAAWLMQRRTGQDGWADAFWSLGLGLVGAAAALVPIQGQPLSVRQGLVALMIGLWGLRLGFHIARRALTEPSDRRYAALRADWGDRASVKMFGFLMLQAGAAALLLISVLLAAHHPQTSVSLQDLLAASLFITALIGTALADQQLANFKSDPANRGLICNTGLWAWSRHPNYFFEWLGWCAWPLLAIRLEAGWAWGWLALSAPVYIYWLLTRVSGIPLLEAHMRASRPVAFRAYAAKTSAFFPRPPKA